MRRLMMTAAVMACLWAHEARAQEAASPTATTAMPQLSVDPAPITIAWQRADGEDVKLLSQMMAANKVESLLEMFLRAFGVVEQQAQQIAALKAELEQRDERLKGIESRLSALEGK